MSIFIKTGLWESRKDTIAPKNWLNLTKLIQESSGGGSTPTIDAVVDVGNTVTSEDSFFTIDKLGFTAELELTGILRSRNNYDTFSAFTISSNNMFFSYTNNNFVAGTYYKSGQIFQEVRDGSNNTSTATLEPNSGIYLEARNSLGRYSAISYQPGGTLFFTASNATSTLSQMRLDSTGFGISLGVSSNFGLFTAAGLTTSRTFTLTNATGILPVINFSAPASSGASGVVGELRSDGTYLYVYASGSWKRVAIATW